MPEHLRYRGDLRNVDRDQMIGPDFGRRYLAVKATAYDPGTDVSTLELRGIMPDEFRNRIEPIVAGQREYARIRKLFGG